MISPLCVYYKRRIRDILEVRGRSHGKRDSYRSFGILRKYYDSRLMGCEAAVEGLIVRRICRRNYRRCP
jgi:hypothetical protein